MLGYFRRDWIALTRAGLDALRTRSLATQHSRRLALLVVGTVPGAAIGYALQKQAESVFRAPVLTATALIVMGGTLWLVSGVSELTEYL